jgi:hypothetical protein
MTPRALAAASSNLTRCKVRLEVGETSLILRISLPWVLRSEQNPVCARPPPVKVIDRLHEIPCQLAADRSPSDHR